MAFLLKVLFVVGLTWFSFGVVYAVIMAFIECKIESVEAQIKYYMSNRDE